MKLTILSGIILASLATYSQTQAAETVAATGKVHTEMASDGADHVGGIAEGGSDRTKNNAVAEGGSDRTKNNAVAEGGSDRTKNNAVAEGGSDRTKNNAVAEGGSDRTKNNAVAEGGSDRTKNNALASDGALHVGGVANSAEPYKFTDETSGNSDR